MTTAELVELSDLNFVESWRDMTRRGGGTILDEDGLTLFVSPHWLPVLQNGVFRLDDRLPVPEVLARTRRFFAARGFGYTVILRAHADADLQVAALAEGLVQMGDMPAMVLRKRLPDATPPAGVALTRVTTAADAADYAAVMQAAYATYGMPDGVTALTLAPLAVQYAPHIVTILARADGVPVAGAMTIVTHGVAGIYWVGTTPEARGRGLAELVTRAAGNAGFDLGGRIASLQASVMGEPVYARMGYETVTRYPYVVQLTPPEA